MRVLPSLSIMKTTIEEKAMNKRKSPPTHPGGILKRLYLAPMEITVSELSKRIGVHGTEKEDAQEENDEVNCKSSSFHIVICY